MKQTILNLWKENRTLSMIVQMQIIYSKKVLKSNLCDNNVAYILVRVNITITAASATQI